MTSDNSQAFMVNPWKVELVGAFFQNGIKKRENYRMPPLVFEDCDVSTICVASDADTTIDEDRLKIVVNSGFARDKRRDEKNKDLADVAKVGNLKCVEAKSQGFNIDDKPSVSGIMKSKSLKKDGEFNYDDFQDTVLPVLKFSSSPPCPSSGLQSSKKDQSCLLSIYPTPDLLNKKVSLAKEVSSAIPFFSAMPRPSARPFPSARPVSSARPVPSAQGLI